MEKKMSNNNERSGLDDIVLFLTYSYIKNALYLMEVMCVTVKQLMLDEKLTPEVKKNMKRDMGIFQNSMLNLKSAQRGYEQMTKNLEIIEQTLDNHVNAKHYSYAQSVCHEILASDIMYMAITDGDTEDKTSGKNKIFNYLKKFKVEDDVTNAVGQLRSNAESLRNETDFKQKEGWM